MIENDYLTIGYEMLEGLGYQEFILDNKDLIVWRSKEKVLYFDYDKKEVLLRVLPNSKIKYLNFMELKAIHYLNINLRKEDKKHNNESLMKFVKELNYSSIILGNNVKINFITKEIESKNNIFSFELIDIIDYHIGCYYACFR